MSAPRGMFAPGLCMLTPTNKQTNKQTNNYMSAPRGMSAPRFMYAHTHSQTNKITNKQTNLSLIHI